MKEPVNECKDCKESEIKGLRRQERAERFHSCALVEPTLELVKTHGNSPLQLYEDDECLREFASEFSNGLFSSIRVVPRLPASSL